MLASGTVFLLPWNTSFSTSHSVDLVITNTSLFSLRFLKAFPLGITFLAGIGFQSLMPACETVNSSAGVSSSHWDHSLYTQPNPHTTPQRCRSLWQSLALAETLPCPGHFLTYAIATTALWCCKNTASCNLSICTLVVAAESLAGWNLLHPAWNTSSKSCF